MDSYLMLHGVVPFLSGVDIAHLQCACRQWHTLVHNKENRLFRLAIELERTLPGDYTGRGSVDGSFDGPENNWGGDPNSVDSDFKQRYMMIHRGRFVREQEAKRRLEREHNQAWRVRILFAVCYAIVSAVLPISLLLEEEWAAIRETPLFPLLPTLLFTGGVYVTMREYKKGGRSIAVLCLLAFILFCSAAVLPKPLASPFVAVLVQAVSFGCQFAARSGRGRCALHIIGIVVWVAFMLFSLVSSELDRSSVAYVLPGSTLFIIYTFIPLLIVSLFSLEPVRTGWTVLFRVVAILLQILIFEYRGHSPVPWEPFWLLAAYCAVLSLFIFPGRDGLGRFRIGMLGYLTYYAIRFQVRLPLCPLLALGARALPSLPPLLVLLGINVNPFPLRPAHQALASLAILFVLVVLEVYVMRSHSLLSIIHTCTSAFSDTVVGDVLSEDFSGCRNHTSAHVTSSTDLTRYGWTPSCGPGPRLTLKKLAHLFNRTRMEGGGVVSGLFNRNGTNGFNNIFQRNGTMRGPSFSGFNNLFQRNSSLRGF